MWNVRWKIRILVCISALWVHYLNSALVLDMNKLLVKSQIRKYLNLFLKLCTFYASVTLINFAKVVEKYQNSTLCLSVCALGTAQKLCSLDTSSILKSWFIFYLDNDRHIWTIEVWACLARKVRQLTCSCIVYRNTVPLFLLCP